MTTVATENKLETLREMGKEQPARGIVDRITRVWRSPVFDTLPVQAGFWLFLIALCAVRAFVGLSAVRVFSHDAFMVLDGAWRMLHGQRPHVDFNSMVGPAAYLPTVIGFRLSGNTVAGFGYGQALVGLLVGVWAFLLGKGMAGLPRMLLALGILSVALSPATLGPSPLQLSPGMTYNRYTFALVALLLMECVRERPGPALLTGVSTGVLFGLTVFLKMTGAVVGVFLLLALWPVKTQTRDRWMGIGLGAVGTMAAFLAYLRFAVGPVLRDLALTAAAKRIDVYARYDLETILSEATFGLFFLGVASLWFARQGRRVRARRVLWLGCVTVCASTLMIFGNFQRSGMPLVTFALVLVVDQMYPGGRELSSDSRDTRALVTGGTVLLAATLPLSLMLTLLCSVYLAVHTSPRLVHMKSRALRAFTPLHEELSYTSEVNDGIDLLQAYRRPGERVMCLDFTNPFSFGLGIPPAPGGTTNLQFDGSFNEKHRLSPEQLFGAADLVMYPRIFSDESLKAIMPVLYGPYLHTHFHPVGTTYYWVLYRRDASQ